MPTPTAIPAPPTAPRRKAPAVLVVDDNGPVRRVARDALGAAGYAVLTAPDGEAGLALFARERDRVGLVVLDGTMPGLCGTETLLRLVALDPGVRVLFSSADRPDAPVGVIGVLPKPYRPHQLVNAVRAVLGEPGAGATG